MFWRARDWKKRGVRNIALELFEAFAFELNKGFKVHHVVAAVADRGLAEVNDPSYRKNLGFLASPNSFGAAVTARKLLNAPCRINKLLFAGEKGMTSRANTDLNIAARGASVIHRTTCAYHVCLVILWMNTGFHLWKGTRNLLVQQGARKR